MSSTGTIEPPDPARQHRLQTVLPVWLLAVPGTLVVAVSAILFAVLPFGIDPIWSVEPLTLPEAAALRDNAEVVRLIGLGGDIDAPGPVRPGISRDEALVLTPLEAATGSRRADMVLLLLEQGAALPPETWTRLSCIAAAVRADEVQSLLASVRPDGATESCAGVETPWRGEEG